MRQSRGGAGQLTPNLHRLISCEPKERRADGLFQPHTNLAWLRKDITGIAHSFACEDQRRKPLTTSVSPIAVGAVSLRRRVIRTIIPATFVLCLTTPLSLLGASYVSA